MATETESGGVGPLGGRGNAGTAQLGVNLDINPEDLPVVVSAARERRIDLVAVGPGNAPG